MAESTTMLYGTDMVIEAEKGTGVVDLSGSSNACNIKMTAIVGEARVFNTKWVQRVITAKDCQIDLAAWYSSTADEALDYFKDWFAEAAPGSKQFTFYIPRKEAGADKIQGDFVFTGPSMDIKSGDNQPIPVQTTLMSTGAVTWTTYST